MPLVRTEDLIDANGVAGLLGLSHRNSVSGYQRRYPDMPRPIVTFSDGRTPVWLRSEIEEWLRRRGPVQRGRPKGASQPEAAKSLTDSPTSARRPRKR